MTQRDKWCKRPATDKYWTFKDLVQKAKITIPSSGAHIIFHMPIPKSLSEKKRLALSGQPHQKRPDKDNLEKALLDAVFSEDSHIWDSRSTKLWALIAGIEIRDL